MKEKLVNKLLKIVGVLCVLVAVLAGANFLELVTKVPKEFWWETICLVHISVNITNWVIDRKK